MLARSPIVLACVSASLLIAPRAHAQSLGGRLGSPSGGVVPPPPAAPPGVSPPAVSPPAAQPEANPHERDLFVRASAPSYGDPTPGGAPPDVVLTNDGGILRGTIVRSEPGRSVQLQLPTGEVTEIAWGNVRFAGPAHEAPPMTAPAPPPAPTITPSPGIRITGGHEVHLRFVSDQPLTLHNSGATAISTASVPWSWVRVNARSDRWDRVCTAPCELDIQPGQYRLGVSVNGRGPFPGPLVTVRESGQLYGHYVDNSGLRAGGWIVFLLGLAAGGLGVTFGILEGGALELIVPGAILGGVALIAGIPMMAAGNGVVFRFE